MRCQDPIWLVLACRVNLEISSLSEHMGKSCCACHFQRTGKIHCRHGCTYASHISGAVMKLRQHLFRNVPKLSESMQASEVDFKRVAVRLAWPRPLLRDTRGRAEGRLQGKTHLEPNSPQSQFRSSAACHLSEFATSSVCGVFCLAGVEQWVCSQLGFVNIPKPNQLVLQPLDLQELQFLNLARLAYAATSACLQEA